MVQQIQNRDKIKFSIEYSVKNLRLMKEKEVFKNEFRQSKKTLILLFERVAWF